MKPSLHIFLLLAVSLSPSASAASFDCAKAGTTQERMICADSALSTLDDKLAEAYKSAVLDSTDSSETQKQQKEWLRNIRDNCTSKSCLVRVYEKRIDDLASRKAKVPKLDTSCPISEQELIGAWKTVSGGFFEEMTFEYSGSNREFNSWLHQRPDILGGTWKFENCTIFVRHPSEEKMSTFRIVRVDGDRIYLRGARDKDDSIYKRIKQ